jgi:hypothetical protein
MGPWFKPSVLPQVKVQKKVMCFKWMNEWILFICQKKKTYNLFFGKYLKFVIQFILV